MLHKLQTKMLIENTNISKKLCLKIKHKKEEKHMLNPLGASQKHKKTTLNHFCDLIGLPTPLRTTKNMKTAPLNGFWDLIGLLLHLFDHF